MTTKQEQFAGYKWIKVKKYVMDESKSWEERYKELEQHHIAETIFLISQVRALADEIDELDPHISKEDKEKYWDLVRRCMVELLQKAPADAFLAITDYRKGLESYDDPGVEEFAYHEDALSLALSLSEAKETDEIRDKYLEIRESYGW